MALFRTGVEGIDRQFIDPKCSVDLFWFRNILVKAIYL